MKIIFDLRRVGLGNNGGSATIIKSANTLQELGHEVFIIDTGRNQHTWNLLFAKHLIIKNENRIPDADVIIATGYNSVAPTVKAPKCCGIKAHYIRGFETWIMSEQRIVKNILKAPTLKIVNSICLQNKLKEYNIDSTIIRPGYDLNDIYYNNQRGKKIILGGLQTKGKHEAIKRTLWILKTYEYLKKNNYNVELWMFGNEPQYYNQCSKYFQRPTIEQKNFFYNNVSIWLAPSMLEGLHIPPAEAMMAQCPVVSTNAPMSGTQDYMVHGQTGLISENNISSFIKSVELLCKNKSVLKGMGLKARQKIESLGDRKTNMKKLIKYITNKV